MLQLGPHSITYWQSCRRRYLLERDYRVIRWRPRSLFDVLLRRAIFNLSNGGDWQALAADASSQFLQSAANPGLDLPAGANPYAIARTWTQMYDTILATLSKTTLLRVRHLDTVKLSPWLTWEPRAWADDSGTLHSWITAESWDEYDAMRQMHSWYVIGEISALRQPLQLHVILIGRPTKEGRGCCWSRAWKHPVMTNMPYRFRNKDGKRPADSWTAYHYNQNRDDALEWADRIIQDGEYERSTRHLFVETPSDEQADDVQRQILVEALDVRRANEEDHLWQEVPMSRGACDDLIPCPFQYACYSPRLVNIETLGLYQRRDPATVPVK